MRYYLSPLVCAGIILFLSSIPANELPDFSFWRFFSFDKIVHVGMYSVLSFQVMRSCIRQYANWNLRYHAGLVAAVISIAYGGAIELYQEFILSDRHGEWSDLIANVLGAWLGTRIFKLIFSAYLR